MKAKYSLLAYVSGKRITVKIKKGAAQMPEGATRFYVRYTDASGRRRDRALGNDFQEALAEVRTLDARTEYERKTGEKLPALPLSQKKTLREEVREWLDLKAMTPGIAPSTVKTYEKGMKHFLVFAAKENPPVYSSTEVTRETVFRFAAHLRAQDYKPLTVHDYFAQVLIFLKARNVHLGIPRKQWGKPAPRKAQKYTDEELDALFLHANSEESLIFKSFLFSGLRNQELANLTYGDINFKTSVWTVQPKHNWETKSDDSVRWVPVPRFHTEDIRERRIQKERKENDLVFPNRLEKRHINYIQLLHKVAQKAGLTGRVDIHKFRSTCATRWLRDGIDVLEVARRLGHANLATIRQYIEMVDKESQAVMDRTSKTFERFDTLRG
jgi:integrase